ncbi:hypothetical protein N2W52_002117 [Clostridium perfringens]|nr:hypothetical protein [Clostridium perfringens]MDK0982901.1 hypothetical protein [Clostridium perfringens]
MEETIEEGLDITNELIMGYPVTLEGLGTIYQPTIKDILLNKKYQFYLFPFIYNIEILSKELKDKGITEYDLFFLLDEEGNEIVRSLDNKESMLEVLIKALTFFYRTKDIVLNFEKQTIKINDDVVITRHNFDLLSKAILKICCKEKMKPEEKKTFKSERQRAIYEKIEKHRERHRKKNELTIADIINYLMNNSINCYRPREIDELTYFQLLHNFENIVQIEQYKEGLAVMVSPKFEMKEELVHYRTKNKIKKITI